MRSRLSIGHWISLYLLNLLFCYLAGKDYNWDLLNYHFYGPALLLDNRWSQDYFAGSIQSYLNPIAYVPFFLMVKSGWPALLIGLVLSTFHFLNIVVIGSIAEKLLLRQEGDKRTLIYIICLLAMVAPPYLQANGSSFNDPYGSIFILLGLRALLQEDAHPERQAVFAGLCSGIATGIKLTSATFAVAFAVVFVIRAFFERRSSPGRVVLQLGCFCIAAAAAFLAVHGFWSVRLWQEFGSPVFPFFNAIFRAPEFPFINNRDFRFMGSGTLGLLFLPFDMVRAQSWIYSEAVSPDVRPSILSALALAGAGLGLWRGRLMIKGRSQVVGGSASTLWTPAVTVVTFAVVSFLLWGTTSRIGRYAFSLWLLIGPLLGLAAVYMGGIRFARVSLAVVLCLQGYVHLVHGSSRWSPVAWESSWLDFQLPAAVTRQPAGIISTDTLSFSAIVPSLHPASGMATINGMHTMPNGAEMPARLNSLIEKYHDNLYVLYAIGQFDFSAKTEISATRLKILDEKLAPYGLKIGTASTSTACEYGKLPFYRKVHGWSWQPRTQEAYVFAFCKIVETSSLLKNAAAEKSRANDLIFDLIEDKCPEVFSPRRAVTIHHNNEYIRSYFNTASGLYTDHGGLYMTGYRVLFPTYVGQLSEISKTAGATNFVCPSLPAHRYLSD
ncbi:hypothetical protein J2W32_002439 [Variovorax boronicumulans]|uniref:Glycosyltransferase RgtA/B/C/D-like domain-containing protein n=1 Tax=Variovorax boronicumulans TaxID=436515 RepID=A0AAW8D2L6_9BURK|nr:glycosyltransferase 87 family protein [Variovorax boronicumulans]MDP9893495.1 hypothetical protein [Variovorax boronicumulans]MDQ0053391.1 hypothetical protein [Variovorax boronicumulans]